ncbi:unnamed protein product, partial [Mesorhabditis spiculigera]
MMIILPITLLSLPMVFGESCTSCKPSAIHICESSVAYSTSTVNGCTRLQAKCKSSTAQIQIEKLPMIDSKGDPTQAFEVDCRSGKWWPATDPIAFFPMVITSIDCVEKDTELPLI